MRNKLFAASIGLAGLLTAQQALAVPFSSFDPRSFAMGGAGVASGTSSNAVFFNPALLAAASQDDDFSFELLVGARAADPENFVDAVDAFAANNSMQGFSDAITGYTFSQNPTTLAAVTSAAAQLTADLQSLSQKAVQLEGNAAFVVGVPSETFGLSVYGNAWVVGGSVADVTAADIAAIDAVVTTLPAIPADPTGTLTSSVSVRFATITEAGIAIASNVNGLAIGITPKHVKVTTNDFKFVGSEIDTATIDTDIGEVSDTNFNVDIGVAVDYGNGWKVGAAVKNALAQEYTTILGNTITIDPMARVGLMHETSWSTIALDVDVTENDPGGFDTKTQYAALGIEFDIFDTAQMRFGMRHNMSDTPYEADTLSAGIGVSPFGIHLDLSVAGNNDEVGGALQLGFSF